MDLTQARDRLFPEFPLPDTLAASQVIDDRTLGNYIILLRSEASPDSCAFCAELQLEQMLRKIITFETELVEDLIKLGNFSEAAEEAEGLREFDAEEAEKLLALVASSQPVVHIRSPRVVSNEGSKGAQRRRNPPRGRPAGW